jgi:hypothetical protein
MREELGGGESQLAKDFQARFREAALVTRRGGRKDKNKLFSDHPVMVIVLGPSGSGKSYSFSLHMGKLLRDNGLDEDMNFLSVDGGLMREQSKVYQEVIALAKRLPGVLGFSDAQNKISKDATHEAKSYYKKAWIGHDRAPGSIAWWPNIVVPDTATTCINTKVHYLPGFCNTWDFLAQASTDGYRIIMAGVNTDQNNCHAQGMARAIGEGKVYSSKNWMKSVYAVKVLFEQAYTLPGVMKVSMIIDNNDHVDTTREDLPLNGLDRLQNCEFNQLAQCRDKQLRKCDVCEDTGGVHYYTTNNASEYTLEQRFLTKPITNFGKTKTWNMFDYDCSETKNCTTVQYPKPCRPQLTWLAKGKNQIDKICNVARKCRTTDVFKEACNNVSNDIDELHDLMTR